MASKLPFGRRGLLALLAAVLLGGPWERLANASDVEVASDEDEDGDDEFLEESENWRWHSHARVGHRSLSLEGSEALYRTVVDQSPGVRLFDLDIDGSTWRPAESFADRFSLRAHGFGGEPEQDLRLKLARRGRYALKVRLRRVDSRFEVPSYQLGQHATNYERERITLGLTTSFGKASAWIRLRREEKEGPGTTTQILGSNEFLLDDLLERKSESLSVGTRFPVGPVTLTFQQNWADTERSNLDSLAAGAEEGNQGSSELEGWDRETRSDSDSSTTSLALQVPFKSRGELSARLTYGGGDSDSFMDRDARQVRPGPPSGIQRKLLANGDVDRVVRAGELGLTIHATDRLSFHDTLRLRSADSWGDLAATTTVIIGTRETVTELQSLTSYEERSLENELSMSYRFRKRVVLRAGLRHREREMDWNRDVENEPESQSAEYSDARLFVAASWRPGAKLHLQGDVELGDQTRDEAEPSLLLRTEPSDTAAVGVRMRFHPTTSSSIGLALRYRHGENPDPSDEHHEDRFSAAVTGELRIGEKLELLGSLTRLRHDASTLLDITVDGDRVKPTQLYRLRQTGLDLRCTWRAHEKLSLALRLSGIDATGSLPTRWYQLEPSLSLHAPAGWDWRVGYLLSRYDRESFPDEDFRAEAFVTSVAHTF